MSRLDEIKRSIDECTDSYADNGEFVDDIKYLLDEVKRLSNELKKIADMEVPKSAESAFTQDMQEIACNAVDYV